jgi:hypothetical protein
MKIKRAMIIIPSIAGLLLLTLCTGRIVLSFQFKKQVSTLFALSPHPANNAFSQTQLVGLPEPVQRYFRLVLKEGQPYINYIRFTHDGQFRPGLDKDWVAIKGEQYVTTEKPGFIWKGTTATFTARDMYIANEGRLTVSLLSVIKVVDAKGGNYNQGEAIRWLGESILYPTNLLQSERLQWSVIDSQSARLTFNYNGLSLFYIVTFNVAGEIIQLETKRYMDEKNAATWIIKLADYKEMNGVLVPTKFEVLWRLAKGDLSYAKFTMKKLDYGKPEKF